MAIILGVPNFRIFTVDANKDVIEVKVLILRNFMVIEVHLGFRESSFICQMPT